MSRNGFFWGKHHPVPAVVIGATMACAAHQALWKKYKLDHSAGSLAGSKRMLNCHQENLAWNPKDDHEHHPHDQPARAVHHTVL